MTVKRCVHHCPCQPQGKIIDPLLKDAACSGDVKFLAKAIDEGKPEDYFSSYRDYNIFHLAADNRQTDFVKEAIQSLPRDTVLSLLSDDDYLICGYNPLHVAAKEGCIDIVKEIDRFFKSFPMPEDKKLKPWLAWSWKGTPLRVAVRAGHEDCALEILSMDKESFCVWDRELVEMLKEAVGRGWERFPIEVLNSCPPGTLDIRYNDDVVQLINNPKCKPNVREVLYEKLTGYIDGPEKITSSVDKDGQNHLHIAALNNYNEVEFTCEGMNMGSLHSSPLRMKDREGNTPLHLALYNKNEPLVLRFLSFDPESYKIRNANGESALFLAVQFGFEQFAQRILITQYPPFNSLRGVDGQTVFHVLSNCTERTGRLLVKKCWWLINVVDNNGKTALDIAKELSTTWLVDLLNDPPSYQEHFDWVTPFDGDDSTILTFYKNYQNLHELCLAKMDTPLHHMKLGTYQNYQNFLGIPSIAELKNFRDSNGATPLHKAIQRRDVRMAKLLLTDNEVDRSVEDNDGRTPMDLLCELCRENEEWDKMCKQIGVNPFPKAVYTQNSTGLFEMRNTLSVVAALLATITFAAGFTLPGGVNNDTGYAILGKDAAFLVFLLADGFAMCTSMLVLICLIWSMACDNIKKSRTLISSGMVILMYSLYSTLVAFMTGIFTVVAEKSFWTAIFIIVMCSLLGLSANSTFLYKLVSKLPSIETNHDDSTRARTLVRKIAAKFKSITEPNSLKNKARLPVLQEGGDDLGAPQVAEHLV